MPHTYIDEEINLEARLRLAQLRRERADALVAFERTGDASAFQQAQTEIHAWHEAQLCFEWTDTLRGAWEACHPNWEKALATDRKLRRKFERLQAKRLRIDPKLAHEMLEWLETMWQAALADGMSAVDQASGSCFWPKNGFGQYLVYADIERMRVLAAYTARTGRGFEVH